MSINKSCDSTGADFRALVRSTIVRKIAELRKQGVNAMSADNLYQLCRFSQFTPGAPCGTNAAWQMRTIFSECLRSCGPRVHDFVLGVF